MSHWYTEGNVEFDLESVSSMVNFLRVNGIVQVAYDEDKLVGFLMAAIGPIPFNFDYTQASEIAFMVHPEYRKTGVGANLIKQAENVCRQQKVRYLNMVNLESVFPEKTEGLYKSQGYFKSETVFTKEV